MTPISFTYDHYPTVREWWIGHAWTPPPLEILPAIGYIVENHAAAWLYHDSTAALGVMEYIVTNPQNTPLQSARAIAALVQSITAHAHTLGKTHLLTTCRQASLAKFLTQVSDFILSDQHMIHLVKPLQPPQNFSPDH